MKFNKKYFNPKDRNGFTLLEVLAVMTILGVGLVSVLSLANYVVYVPEISANRMTAAALAQKKLEEVRFTRDSNWATTGALWTVGICGSGSTIVSLNGINFTSTITNDCTNSGSGYIVASASVTWAWRGKNYTFGPMKTTLYNWKQ